MTTRIFCALTSLLSILFDDHVNGPDYAYLTNKDLDRNYQNQNYKITILVNLVVLVLVQIKIEIFKKSVDESHQINDSEENQETNSEYNKNTVRIVLVMICLTLLITLGWSFQEDEKGSRLWVIVAYNFILTNVLPIVLIKRNQNLCDFCKNQFPFIRQKISTPQSCTVVIHPNFNSRSRTHDVHVEESYFASVLPNVIFENSLKNLYESIPLY